MGATMPRKPKRDQMGLPGVDTRPRTGATVEIPRDFSAMTIGTGAGDGLVIVACPVCLRPCVALGGAVRWQFVHVALFIANAKRTRMKAKDACELGDEIVTKLAKLGAIKLSATRKLESASSDAPALAEELKRAQADFEREAGRG